MRSPAAVVLAGALGVAALTGFVACSNDGGNDGGNGTETDTGAGTTAPLLLALPDSRPGDVIALRTDGTTLEWIDRRAGTIRSIPVGPSAAGSIGVEDITTLVTIDVGTEGEQRGLLGHTVIDGARYAAWTDPDTLHLIVGEVGPEGVMRIVWDGGGTAGGAVGGHLQASADGQLILGIGQLTDWAKANGSGAMVQLDPAGPADQEPVVLSDGYTNPFAFTVVDGELWVADNAVGDDVERIGRGDLADRDDLTATGRDPRAPSALVALPSDSTLAARPGGQLFAVCGFLDAQLLLWDPSADGGYGDSIGPCLTGAAVLSDGRIVTATADGLVVITN